MSIKILQKQTTIMSKKAANDIVDTLFALRDTNLSADKQQKIVKKEITETLSTLFDDYTKALMTLLNTQTTLPLLIAPSGPVTGTVEVITPP